MITPQINELDVIVVSYWITYICLNLRYDDIRNIINDNELNKLEREDLIIDITDSIEYLTHRLEHFKNLYTRHI